MAGGETLPPRTHSIKVPRLYKVSAAILGQYRKGSDSIKNLVYGDGSKKTKKHPNVKGIFALTQTCANRTIEMDALLARSRILSDQPGLDRFLAEILIAELLWGKGTLSGESRPVETVLKYENRLREILEQIRDLVPAPVVRHHPRYVRVNTLRTTLRRVVKHLKSEGYVEIIYERSSTDNDAFLSLVKALKTGEFSLDLHVNNLLVFASGTHFYDHQLYQDGSILLQDKASCFSVQALEVPAGSVVLDACAAPGMKTSQLAAAVRGPLLQQSGASGRVIAVERDPKRCQTLREMLGSSGADEVTEVIQGDFLEVRPQDHQDVEYILLDPSCSGSGMVYRAGQLDMSRIRLERLAELQVKLLRHALSFPSVKKVVYSTCSVAEEENEQVVQNVLDASPNFKTVRCLENWHRRGNPGFKKTSKYVRASADEDLCNGFFVAVLQRRKNGSKRTKINKA